MMDGDDLVKKLRDLGDHASFEPHMFHTAADRIESQFKLIDASGKVHASMLARIAELEAALQGIFEEADGDFPDIGDIRFTARAALKDKKDG
jgi:hypothetical protein